MRDSDSNDSGDPPSKPLIPGIYHYCDRLCPRCRFSDRCLSYLARHDAFGTPEPTGAGAALRRSISLCFETVKEEDDEIEVQEPYITPPGAEDAESDPLVVAAREYALTAWRVTEALFVIVGEDGDPIVRQALETITELAASVASKTFRAVSGVWIRPSDRLNTQSDSNGSAKIARIVVGQSRDAWRVLTETGRATANGVPAAMLRALDEIDAGLAARFPWASSFVRPGFDTMDEGP